MTELPAIFACNQVRSNSAECHLEAGTRSKWVFTKSSSWPLSFTRKRAQLTVRGNWPPQLRLPGSSERSLNQKQLLASRSKRSSRTIRGAISSAVVPSPPRGVPKKVYPGRFSIKYWACPSARHSCKPSKSGLNARIRSSTRLLRCSQAFTPSPQLAQRILKLITRSIRRLSHEATGNGLI